MAEKEQHEYKRTLGLAECVFFGVGSIIGAGIYAIIGKVAGHSGAMVWASFGFASLAALASAFSYAEMSSMYPGTGGEYMYAKKAINKSLAIAIGFLITTNGILSGATVSLAFGGYFSELVGINNMLAGIGIIALLYLLNAVGIKHSATTNAVMTTITVTGLLVVVFTTTGEWDTRDYVQMPENGMTGVLVGTALAFYAFIGFEDIIKLGKETKKPETTIPKALFAVCAIVFVLYMGVSVAAVSVLGPDELRETDSPLADVVEQTLGQAGAIGITIIALFATSSTILSNLIGASRIFHGMAEGTSWLQKMTYVSTRGVPIWVLSMVAAGMVAGSLIGDLEIVALIANFFIFATFLLMNISAIVLRYQRPDESRPYKMPLNIGRFPVLSLLGAIITSILVCYTLIGLFGGELLKG